MVDLVSNKSDYPFSYETGDNSRPSTSLNSDVFRLRDGGVESSDSDDELLGITNDPICVKTIRKSGPNRNVQDGWIYHSRNRNNRKPNNEWVKSKLPDITPVSICENINISSRENSRLFNRGIIMRNKCPEQPSWNSICNDYVFPTMETIESPSNIIEVKRSSDGIRQSKDKNTKYQRMREVKSVTGFIVNVHDATNFDIDLDIIPELHEKYRDVISNQYTYQDLDDDFLENPDVNKLRLTPEVGTTFRCRLKGVGINQLPTSEHTWKSNQMCVNVKQLIDRTDGWVTCTLSDIDVYQRLLVDIIIHTSNGTINLRDYLLLKMKDEDNPIFYPYSSKNSSVARFTPSNLTKSHHSFQST